MSRVAVREKACTGETRRTISSTADRDQRRVVDQLLPLARVLDQQLHAARDAVARGLVAGDEQDHAHHDQLVVGEREVLVGGIVELLDVEAAEDPVVLGAGQDAHQVVARLHAAVLDDRA